MKRFTKICLAICAFLVILGVIFCAISAGLGFGFGQFRWLLRQGVFSIGPEDFQIWDEDDWEDLEEMGHWFGGNTTKTTLPDSDSDWKKWVERWPASKIRNLEVSFDFGSLSILPSEEEEIEVEAEYRSDWKSYRRSISWEQQGDTLEIKDEVDNKIFRLFTHGVGDARLTVRIPKDHVFEELSMDIGAADVGVSLDTMLAASDIEIQMGTGELLGGSKDSKDVILKADTLSVEIGAGNIELSGIETETLDADCGAGNLTLKNVIAREVDVDGGVGRVSLEMEGRQEDYDYEVECGIGQVEIGDATYSGLGHSRQIDNGADRSMDINCGIGQVVVSFLER